MPYWRSGQMALREGLTQGSPVQRQDPAHQPRGICFGDLARIRRHATAGRPCSPVPIPRTPARALQDSSSESLRCALLTLVLLRYVLPCRAQRQAAGIGQRASSLRFLIEGIDAMAEEASTACGNLAHLLIQPAGCRGRRRTPRKDRERQSQNAWTACHHPYSGKRRILIVCAAQM